MLKLEDNRKKGEMVVFESDNGLVVDVHLKSETVWLSQKDISLLFGSERSVITKHLNNIFKTGELEKKSNVQKLHIANSDKPVSTYSLDIVLSVGYRVNSKRATQFRVWATKILKKYLMAGYVVNERRLRRTREDLNNLQQTISFLHQKSKYELLEGKADEILNLILGYSKSLTVLELYDKKAVVLKKEGKVKFVLDIKMCRRVYKRLQQELFNRGEAGTFFGQEYEDKLDAIIGAIQQTFSGKELYKSVEEKSANLLYLIIKDHPFADGNKRIATILFLYFLDMNSFLYKENGERKINDNAMIALSLLVAVSDAKEKDVIINIITNLLTE